MEDCQGQKNLEVFKRHSSISNKMTTTKHGMLKKRRKCPISIQKTTIANVSMCAMLLLQLAVLALMPLVVPSSRAVILLAQASLCPSRCTCDNQHLAADCTTNDQHQPLGHVPLTLNPALRTLSLASNSVRQLSSSLTIYRELEYLNLASNELTHIEQRNFAHLTHLLTLLLSDNRIESLGAGSATTHYHQQLALHQRRNDAAMADSVIVADNNSQAGEEPPFVHLKSLRHLYLNNNRLVELTRNTFHGLAHLRHLDLSSNPLAHVHQRAFAGLTALRSLSLRGTRVTLAHLPRWRLHLWSPALVTLDLGLNPTGAGTGPGPGATFEGQHTLTAHLFGELRQLRQLYLDACALTELHPDAFAPRQHAHPTQMQHQCNSSDGGSVALQQLCEQPSANKDNDSSSVDIVVDSSNKVSNLRRLFLGHNSLQPMTSSDTWRPLARLVELDLSNNPLAAHLSAGAFDHLHALRHLRLDRITQLRSIDALAWRQLHNLTRLSVESCDQLQEITITAASPSSTSRESDRGTEGSGVMLPALQSLALRNNRLRHVPQQLARWHTLKQLDLGSNEWQCDCGLTWMRDLLNNALNLQAINVNRPSEMSTHPLGSASWLSWRDTDLVPAPAAAATTDEMAPGAGAPPGLVRDPHSAERDSYWRDQAHAMRLYKRVPPLLPGNNVSIVVGDVLCHEPRSLRGHQVALLDTSLMQCPSTRAINAGETAPDKLHDDGDHDNSMITTSSNPSTLSSADDDKANDNTNTYTDADVTRSMIALDDSTPSFTATSTTATPNYIAISNVGIFDDQVSKPLTSSRSNPSLSDKNGSNGNNAFTDNNINPSSVDNQIDYWRTRAAMGRVDWPPLPTMLGPNWVPNIGGSGHVLINGNGNGNGHNQDQVYSAGDNTLAVEPSTAAATTTLINCIVVGMVGAVLLLLIAALVSLAGARVRATRAHQDHHRTSSGGNSSSSSSSSASSNSTTSTTTTASATSAHSTDHQRCSMGNNNKSKHDITQPGHDLASCTGERTLCYAHYTTAGCHSTTATSTSGHHHTTGNTSLLKQHTIARYELDDVLDNFATHATFEAPHSSGLARLDWFRRKLLAPFNVFNRGNNNHRRPQCMFDEIGINSDADSYCATYWVPHQSVQATPLSSSSKTNINDDCHLSPSGNNNNNSKLLIDLGGDRPDALVRNLLVNSSVGTTRLARPPRIQATASNSSNYGCDNSTAVSGGNRAQIARQVSSHSDAAHMSIEQQQQQQQEEHQYQAIDFNVRPSNHRSSILTKRVLPASSQQQPEDNSNYGHQ